MFATGDVHGEPRAPSAASSLLAHPFAALGKFTHPAAVGCARHEPFQRERRRLGRGKRRRISTPVNARMAVPISSQPICHRAPVAPVKRALNSWMNSAPVDAGKHCTLSGPRHPASANTRAHASAIRCGSASSSREIERAL
jgi:hypothetical protein